MLLLLLPTLVELSQLILPLLLREEEVPREDVDFFLAAPPLAAPPLADLEVGSVNGQFGGNDNLLPLILPRVDFFLPPFLLPLAAALLPPFDVLLEELEVNGQFGGGGDNTFSVFLLVDLLLLLRVVVVFDMLLEVDLVEVLEVDLAERVLRLLPLPLVDCCDVDSMAHAPTSRAFILSLSIPPLVLLLEPLKSLSLLEAANRSAYTLSFEARCNRCLPLLVLFDEVLLLLLVVEEMISLAVDRLRFCPVLIIN